jgi:hypothetical protein
MRFCFRTIEVRKLKSKLELESWLFCAVLAHMQRQSAVGGSGEAEEEDAPSSRTSW